MHCTPSLQRVGQAPGWPAAMAVSQTSPARFSTTPSPQVGPQSGSLAAVQPDGQQPSAAGAQAVTACTPQTALQWSRSPVRTRLMHAEGLAGQAVGQGTVVPAPGSHASPSSRTPLPHLAAQSLSRLWFPPPGQQPSSAVNDVMGV